MYNKKLQGNRQRDSSPVLALVKALTQWPTHWNTKPAAGLKLIEQSLLHRR